MYSLYKIKTILGLKPNSNDKSKFITSLEIDSRKIVSGRQHLFLCLSGIKRDGHDYIEDAYSKGVRHFLVTRIDLPKLPDVSYLKVPNVLKALQTLATFKRSEAKSTTVVGITGSNAKTIVKEWLFQLCHPQMKSMRSPKSYNSQIGVALSLWNLEEDHEIGIIEAGISNAGEMSTITEMVKPQIGIFTNIGDAHSAGFRNRKQKIIEKCKLFSNCKSIIVHSGHEDIFQILKDTFGKSKIVSWGYLTSDNIVVSRDNTGSFVIEGESLSMIINVKDKGIHNIENLLHCVVAANILGIDTQTISDKIPLLENLEMRLEHIVGRDNSLLINDAYIADIASLEVAMNHVASLQHNGPVTVILSDFYGQHNKDEVYRNVENLLNKYRIDRLITVGDYSEVIRISGSRHHYPNTISLLESADLLDWQDQLVLIKGSRSFHLDTLVNKLEKSSHSAYLEIDIPSLHHNLTEIRNHCPPSCGLIAVIKASAYGAGIEKIASAINNHDPAYFAVAYADEGIKLRHSGIQKPIIILNPDEHKIDILHQYDLEPVVHSLPLLQQLFVSSGNFFKPLNIHIKMDTGMHRLGFSEADLETLCLFLDKNKWLCVKTIFSHLSASENEIHDGYSHLQADLFEKMSKKLMDHLEYTPKRHFLNSEGIWRFPHYSYDYVRAGITMYGISNHHSSLKKVHSLNAKVISIKTFSAGESIGYGRSEFLQKTSHIAVINIGYADGLMRSGSNGITSVYVKGIQCPVAGKICMDVAMIDVSACTDVKLGDTVEIFGNHIAIEEYAQKVGTIPYEILCGISPRIVRKYIMD